MRARSILPSDCARRIPTRRGCGARTGPRRGPHFCEARREPADDHRDRVVRRDVPDLLPRAASRAPSRRLLRDTGFDFPADRRRDADVGDAPATPRTRIRRVAIRDGVGAGTNRRLAYRLDSCRQTDPARRTSRARTRMHQPHDKRTLAQPHNLGLDFVARRPNFDQRFDGIDSGRVHDRAGLPADRRFESGEPDRVALEREGSGSRRDIAQSSKCQCSVLAPETALRCNSYSIRTDDISNATQPDFWITRTAITMLTVSRPIERDANASAWMALPRPARLRSLGDQKSVRYFPSTAISPVADRNNAIYHWPQFGRASCATLIQRVSNTQAIQTNMIGSSEYGSSDRSQNEGSPGRLVRSRKVQVKASCGRSYLRHGSHFADGFAD